MVWVTSSAMDLVEEPRQREMKMAAILKSLIARRYYAPSFW